MQTEEEKTRKTVRLPNIKSLTIGDCFVRITLNTRHLADSENQTCPISISFYVKGFKKTLYRNLPYKVTRKEYLDIYHSTGRGRRSSGDAPDRKTFYDIKTDIIKEFDEVTERLRTYAGRNPITWNTLQTFIAGKESSGTRTTFVSFWEKFNQTKSAGTKSLYEDARKSFVRIVGEPKRNHLTAEDIKTWEEGMAGLTKSTVSIYLRACRAAWNEAVRQGLALRDDKPFGKIPQSTSRKRDWLDTDRMTELYTVFINEDYPQDWKDSQRRFIHRSLGLFLFQYLGNGCNLADVARLTWNDDYFQSGGRILTFIRQKTETKTNMEVVIPITEPLRQVIDRIATPPEKGRPMFPDILKGETDPEKTRKQVAQTNKRTLDGLRVLTEHLGWPVKPSGIWARHSFATNLSHAGIPERYISEAMGHAIKTVTSGYIDAYPIDQLLNNNAKLLKLKPDISVADEGETITLSLKEYNKLVETLREIQKYMKE